jgi:hypothetical protein
LNTLKLIAGYAANGGDESIGSWWDASHPRAYRHARTRTA